MKMRAAVYTQYGPPEVVQVTELDKPSPKDGEVLIKVHATTVNRTDCGFRSAEYFISRFFSGLLRPRNKILGNEFAGQIEAIGSGVSLFKPGDQVFGFTDTRFGAHAEYMTLGEQEALTHMPPHLSYQQAAPLTEGGHYALCILRAAKVKPGQNVLVNGATGAIGSAAVQLLHYFGARVTAVCPPQHVALVSSLGAETVIDYSRQDFTQLPQTFDLVVDAVGKSSFGQCKKILSPKGIYISTELGKNWENIFLALLTPLRSGRKVLFPIPSISQEDVVFFKKLVESQQYRPVIDRHYALEEIIEAYRYVETGRKTGNVVIDLSR